MGDRRGEPGGHALRGLKSQQQHSPIETSLKTGKHGQNREDLGDVFRGGDFALNRRPGRYESMVARLLQYRIWLGERLVGHCSQSVHRGKRRGSPAISNAPRRDQPGVGCHRWILPPPQSMSHLCAVVNGEGENFQILNVRENLKPTAGCVIHRVYLHQVVSTRPSGGIACNPGCRSDR